MSNFVVLGIHGPDVSTVEGNVARVRTFIAGSVYDFDIELPVVKTFDELLKENIQTKLDALSKDADGNPIPDETYEQVVTSQPDPVQGGQNV